MEYYIGARVKNRFKACGDDSYFPKPGETGTIIDYRDGIDNGLWTVKWDSIKDPQSTHEQWLTLINMEELKIQKERVLQEAEKCETFKRIASGLWPEVFNAAAEVILRPGEHGHIIDNNTRVPVGIFAAAGNILIYQDFDVKVERKSDQTYITVKIKKLNK